MTQSKAVSPTFYFLSEKRCSASDSSWSGSTRTYGMSRCRLLCNHTLSAMVVIPGVLAIASNVGAFGSGDRVWPETTAWQAEQALSA
ncbi:MAG: hypothetical protein ABL956_08370 [Hyphomonadaceae bacterium]